jgi:hypothetical protein
MKKLSIYLILILLIITKVNTINAQSTKSSTQDIKPTIHMLIFADTDDERIGESCLVDYNNIKRTASEIAYYTELQINKKYFKGVEFNQENLKKTLEELKINKNDVVFFYYSGHGYRTVNSESKFPRMAIFKTGETLSENTQGVSTEEVKQFITSKEPRLTIIFVDACNVTVGLNEPASGLLSNPSKEQYQRLFLYSKGEVILGGSKQGISGTDYEGYSWGSTKYGGYCTYNFLEELDKIVKQQNVAANWNDLMYNTMKGTSDMTEAKQIPVYTLKIQ